MSSWENIPAQLANEVICCVLNSVDVVQDCRQLKPLVTRNIEEMHKLMMIFAIPVVHD